MFGVGRSGDQPGGKGPESGEDPASEPGGERNGGDPQGAESKGGDRKGRAPAARVIAIGAAAAAVVAAGTVYAVTQHPGSQAAHAAEARPVTQVATGPIRVDAITPGGGATQVNGAQPVVVSFSAPLAANSPDPQVNPSVPGTWTAQGNSLVFTPQVAFAPSHRITVQVPGGPAGVRSISGGLLRASVTEHFTTAQYSQARLAELLAQLGYLPVTWSGEQNGMTRALAMTGTGGGSPQAEAYDPPAGVYHWRYGYPSILRSMWSASQPNVIVRGAVMAFQAQHSMLINGGTTPRFWAALFTAVAHDQRNQVGYTYAIASKNVPETLTIWHDGRVVMRSLANTGIPVSPTVDGTFPVYQRYRFQIMSGTNPDGSHYADPVSFVSYFNGGDAVHYFPRGSYGFQQSLGLLA